MPREAEAAPASAPGSARGGHAEQLPQGPRRVPGDAEVSPRRWGQETQRGAQAAEVPS